MASERERVLDVIWRHVAAPSLAEMQDESRVTEGIERASRRQRETPGATYRIPLLPLHWSSSENQSKASNATEETTAETSVLLKAENLQPVGSFKLRAACNAVVDKLSLVEETKENERSKRVRVITASAGNMGQGVAWIVRHLNRQREERKRQAEREAGEEKRDADGRDDATVRRVDEVLVIVPDHAPEQKLMPMRRLGAVIAKVPFGVWWQLIDRPERKEEGRKEVVVENGAEEEEEEESKRESEEEEEAWERILSLLDEDEWENVFVHPVCDESVLHGNGTVGFEILADEPDVTAVIVPYGGGALSCGIAAAVRARTGGRVPVYAVEVETAAPLVKALEAGKSVTVDYTPSFIDGMGGSQVIPQMFPLASGLLAGSVVVTPDEVAAGVKLIAERNRLIVEGAGAAAAAAVVSGKFAAMVGPAKSQLLKKVVCICSGGGLDHKYLSHILLTGTAPRVTP